MTIDQPPEEQVAITIIVDSELYHREINREVKRLERGNILSYLIHKEENDA